MAAASEAVVLVRATNDVTVDHLGEELPVPFTTTRLDMLQTLSGELEQKTLRLRQFGTADEPGELVVRPGSTYAIAVTPLVYDLSPKAPPTNQYVVSGTPAGLFLFDEQQQHLTRLDAGSPCLPARIALRDFSRQVASR